jgi:transposase-like protein
MAQRGVVLTSETIRQWCLKVGHTYANELRHRRPRCGDTWHMDEMVLTIRGKKHSLWRAVDQDGNVPDILVQSRRHTKAAKRCFRKLLKGLQDVPRVIITDKLKSYGAVKREMLPGVEHRQPFVLTVQSSLIRIFLLLLVILSCAKQVIQLIHRLLLHGGEDMTIHAKRDADMAMPQ